MSHDSISFYNRHAKEFESGTLNVDMTELEDWFLSYLPGKGRILDFGSGTGRDSKYFLSKGFRVDAIDGSKEMCSLTFINSGVNAKLTSFQQFVSESECYDGIWASASLLHLSLEELPSVFKRLEKALKKSGILYCSFKYGIGERCVGERFFTDMTESSFQELLQSFDNSFVLLEEKATFDVRKGRDSEKWLNMILQKG